MPDQTETLSVRLWPSRWLLGTLSATHLAALAALALSRLPVAARALAVAAVVASLVYGLYRYAGPGGGFVDRLRLGADGIWRLCFAGGRRPLAARLTAYYLHPALVVLNFTRRGRPYSLAIVADAAPPEQLRRLRRYLATKPRLTGD